MKSKTTNKSARPMERKEPAMDDRMRMACEAHTLAHILYRDLATTQTWLAGPIQARGFETLQTLGPAPPPAWPTAWAGPGPHFPAAPWVR